jgi:hypothetical protein
MIDTSLPQKKPSLSTRIKANASREHALKSLMELAMIAAAILTLALV